MNNIIVLKCGGSTVDELTDHFFDNVISLKKSGLIPVIVHGGGLAIKSMLDQLNMKSSFVDGLRVTPEPMIDIVEMVLSGDVNNAITRKFNEAGIKAVGLSGSDANLLTAEAKNLKLYGYVGEVVDVNVSLIHQLIAQNIIPVIAPLALGKDNKVYNINADTAAGAVAKALHAKQLVFITDVPGIIHEGKLIESITIGEIERLIDTGIIHGGMIPKVKAAIHSLSEELQEVLITNGSQTIGKENKQLLGTIVKNSVGVV